jgi:ppGpp synthetase/RelA/SpoT-type nucleotidyltranferase
MAAPRVELPSKGEINRCGAFLVEVVSSHPDWDRFSLDDVDHAIKVVSDFRSAHGYPLLKANVGLRSMVKTEGCPVLVSQRLKRLPRIVRKLGRMPGTNLARLEDVGGCRAVLPTIDDVRRVHRRLRRNWDGRNGRSRIVRERDYIVEPKEMGYRAVHVVVERDSRRIEVQLRTERQQRWAEAIESVDARLAMTLKDGTGPPEMTEFFSAAGELQFVLDSGMTPSDELVKRMSDAREAVVAAGHYTR